MPIFKIILMATSILYSQVIELKVSQEEKIEMLDAASVKDYLDSLIRNDNSINHMYTLASIKGTKPINVTYISNHELMEIDTILIRNNKEVKRTITGKVVSDSMDKTITVAIERKLKHPLYNKYIFKTSKIMAHDENGDSKVGDIVAIEETKPISKNKSWTLNKIIKESQQEN